MSLGAHLAVACYFPLGLALLAVRVLLLAVLSCFVPCMRRGLGDGGRRRLLHALLPVLGVFLGSRIWGRNRFPAPGKE